MSKNSKLQKKELIEFTKFSHICCMSVRKEGNMYFLFPIPKLFEGRWLSIDELYDKYIEFKDNEDFKKLLEINNLM